VGDPHNIGIVGLGVISQAYLDTLAEHPGVRIAAVADLDPARADAVAAGLPGARAMSVDALLDSPDVQTVLNLTIPAAHADIALRAIARNKGVYGEKPLAATFEEAEQVVARAAQGGVPLGCAPDTVLGTGTQTARAAIDAGLIGRPLSAIAVMVTPGHERWHPNPDFYYAPGGGPLLDMGPYYLSSLIQLLGPIRAVTGVGARLRGERTIGSGTRAGERIPVGVDTHVTGVLEHTGGALSTITTSFDGVRTSAAPIEVHGESGTLVVPDPNTFGGDVRLFPLADDAWQVLPPSAGYADASRGVGLLDMITSEARAGGGLALHVLDAMTSLLRSAGEGRRIALSTTTDRPSPVPLTPAEAWRRG
jgi:predicted dehydrogenase